MLLLKKKLPIEKGVPGKVYLLAYREPRSKYEISKILHDDPNRKNVKKIISKLAEEGYLLPVEKEEWKYPKWVSSTEPVLERILQIKGATFTDEEIDRLEDIISSEAFKKFIENTILGKIRKRKGINGLGVILASLDLYLIMVEYYRDKDRRGKVVHDEELEKDKETFQMVYEKAVKNMESMSPEMKKSAIPFGEMFYGADDTEKIPDELIEKVKGVSKAGALLLKAMKDAEIIFNIAEEVDEKYGVDKEKLS